MAERTLVENLRRGTPLENKAADTIEAHAAEIARLRGAAPVPPTMMKFSDLPKTHSFDPALWDDCEDQALAATKHCTQCRIGFKEGQPVYPPLVKRQGFWCCPTCGCSYGAHPHPDLE